MYNSLIKFENGQSNVSDQSKNNIYQTDFIQFKICFVSNLCYEKYLYVMNVEMTNDITDVMLFIAIFYARTCTL